MMSAAGAETRANGQRNTNTKGHEKQKQALLLQHAQAIQAGEFAKAIGALQQLVALDRTDVPKLPSLWIHEIGSLSDTPPKSKWLLTDARTKKKLLRQGKTLVLAADGGVGKSFFWLQLAVCIAMGRDLFEAFRPEAQGYVALLVAEDDRDECMRRLHRICNAMGLSRDERCEAARRIYLFPLTGQEVSLIALDDGGNPRRAETLALIVEQLRQTAKESNCEWAFVGFDPLARFASGNAESDNALATAFVAALESVAQDVPGEPAIGVTHHTSKAANRAGSADVRGVTGIRNAFRAAFTLTKFDAPGETGSFKGCLLENSKNNLAPEAPPLWLVRREDEQFGDRWIEMGGVLRAATDDEIAQLEASAGVRTGASAEQREAAKQTKVREIHEAACALILEVLPSEPDFMNAGALDGALRARGASWGDKKTKTLLEHLASPSGGRLVVDLSSGAQSKPRHWARRQT